MTVLSRKTFLAIAISGLGLVPAIAQQAPAVPPAAPATTPQTAVIAPAADGKVMLVGSVVQLRSGGQKMTIIYLANNVASVQWFQEGAGFKKEEFPIAALKLADEDDSEDDDDEDEDEDEHEDEDDDE